MIKVYLDAYRKKGISYVEDYYSSNEIFKMSVDEFSDFIITLGNEIHSCYPPFINHVARFYRDYNGFNWIGGNLEIYRLENMLDADSCYIQAFFDDHGRLKDWPIGYFG